MLRPHFRRPSLALFLLLTAALIFCAACSSRTIISPESPRELAIERASSAININTADAEELQRLPHVGQGLAAKIIEHRDRYGRFRKAEHLLIIDGMSYKRFREISNLITIE